MNAGDVMTRQIGFRHARDLDPGYGAVDAEEQD
jgi:hypothetical protein